jgi:hypothetical protein
VNQSLVTAITHPIQSKENTAAALEKGYEDLKSITIAVYDKSVVIYQRTDNLISDGYFLTNSEVKDVIKQYVIYKSNPLEMASNDGGLADTYLRSALNTRSEFVSEYSDLVNSHPDIEQYYGRVEESKKMWSKSEISMDKIYENVLEREVYYVKNIQDSYIDKNIRNSDGNTNNVLEYSGDSALGRYMYYEAKLHTVSEIQTDNLIIMLGHDIPVLVSEEGKGAGLYTSALEKGNIVRTGDVYDDRVTKLSMIGGELQIQEYNRANINVSPSSHSSNPNVNSGAYDFIVGEHIDGTKAFNFFDLNNYDKLTGVQQKDLLKDLNNGTLKANQIRQGKYSTLREFNAGAQTGINGHGGSYSSTDSKGCITIHNNDVNNNKTNPNNDFQKLINSVDENQLGKWFNIK